MAEVRPLVFRATARTLTPLHIGSGDRMRQGLDFLEHEGYLWVPRQARLVEALVDEAVQGGMDLTQAVQFITGKTLQGLQQAGWLRDEHFDLERALFGYRLRGRTSASGGQGELHVHVKNVYGRPFVPGSSVKGALRSIFLRHLAAGDSRAPEIERRPTSRPGRFVGTVAARKLERRHFVPGSPPPRKDPNYDLWRALRVLDSQPLPPSVLVLGHVHVLSSASGGRTGKVLTYDVEAIAQGTSIVLGFEVDRWLFQDRRATGLSFRKEHLERFTTDLCCFANGESCTVLAAEEEALRKMRDNPYAQKACQAVAWLRERVEEAQPDEMVLPVGRGTGWRNKTLGRVLLERLSPQEFERLVRDFHLGRGRWRSGGPVPLTRQVVQVGQDQVSPLGWLKVKLEPMP